MDPNKSAKSSKPPANKYFLVLVVLLFSLAVAISVGIIAYVVNHEDKIVTDELIEQLKERQRFSFEGHKDWWLGPTTSTSIVLLNEQNHEACFVSAEYKPGSVDVKSQIEQYKQDVSKYGKDYQVKDIQTVDMELQTNFEPVKYSLHQSEIVAPANQTNLKLGQEYGYIEFDHGYVAIQGFCDTPEQLEATIEAIAAIVFHKS